MNLKGIIFSISLFILMSFGPPKNILKKVNKEITSTFKTENFQLESMLFDQKLPAKFHSNNLFNISSDQKLLGFVYVGKAPSKTDIFDYLILFDTEFVIIKSKILVYREDYGGEIGSKRWLKQFEGKSKNDNLKLHEDVIAISGATISVRSMTLAINNVLESIRILHDKGLLE